MEKIDLPLFYRLGAQLKPLTEMSFEPSKRLDIMVACLPVRSSVILLLSSFPTLTVCRTTAEQLVDAIDGSWKWLREADRKKRDDPDPTADNQFREIISKAKELEIVLNAELQTLATYHATQKGIYSTIDLIERAEKILPLPVLERINPEVIEEIRQSGKCLAFDCATASAFHIMRATEAVMHEYYIAVCKPSSKKRLGSWGEYIAELQKSTKPEIKEVVAMLQQIKDRHRNLIMHPEVVLTPDESFMLFEIAHGSIIAMADQIPKAKKSGRGKTQELQASQNN